MHLTVRSSNTGIFDGEATVSVNVSPKSANVIVYTNGKKMTKQKPLKVGVQEAKSFLISGQLLLEMGLSILEQEIESQDILTFHCHHRENLSYRFLLLIMREIP